MDEAYHEYAVGMDPDYPQSAPYRRPGGPLLVTMRTFSKIYGMAGLCVGYAIADRRMVDYLDRVRRPFNVSSIAQAAALAALDDDEHVQRSLAAARDGIAELRRAIASLGLTAYPSLGNFVLADVGRDSAPVYEALLREGVIVRPMAAWGLPRCIRISIGNREQTARVVAALTTVLDRV
jgi:histidinol-phosphate aminotransferase